MMYSPGCVGPVAYITALSGTCYTDWGALCAINLLLNGTRIDHTPQERTFSSRREPMVAPNMHIHAPVYCSRRSGRLGVEKVPGRQHNNS